MGKNVLYIHQYFRTPSEPGGTRSYWFSKKLIESGYNVTMVTSRSAQKKLFEKENIEGINVIYIKNTYSNDMTVVRRLLSFFRFMLLSSWVALLHKKTDLIFATSTPLTIGLPALMCKWLKGVPYIFEVRDLWPEVPIQMGGLKNLLFQKMAIKFEKVIYKNATHIIALSPGMQQGVIEKGTPKSKVSMIPNMSKIDKFYKREKNKDIATKFGIKITDLNVIHFGTMGRANGLEYILHAALILKKQAISNITFIMLGKGAAKKVLFEKTKEFGLSNILFIDSQPMNIVSELVNLSDVSIVPFSNIPILKTNSPNKLFDSLSAGVPIIVNSAGWTKKLVEDHQCGAYVDPETPEELAKLLVTWQAKPELLLNMGQNSRQLAETKYDKSILSNIFISIIDHFLSKS